MKFLKVQFSKWTNNYTAILMSKQQQMPQIDMPTDYHVWNAMLEHYQRHMPKLANIIPS